MTPSPARLIHTQTKKKPGEDTVLKQKRSVQKP